VRSGQRRRAARRGGQLRTGAGTEDVTRSLEDLRRSIVGPERNRIERLESRPEVDSESVGAVLPEAIAEAAEKREREIAAALEAPVTDAVSTVARHRPEVYAEALAPTIGSSVKKAVAQAIAEMLERLNAALERSVSISSVQWRVEAVRSGRPFAEIALLRTLAYRVEQVYLIHSRTSLVLQHLVEQSLPEQSADQIAAMLSAIEAFGREAFGPMPPEAHLNRFELGELTVWISHDPSLTLAAAIRGAPSVGIAEELRDTLSRVRVRCAAALREFKGDVSTFDGARPMLEPLLRTERRPPARRAEVLLLVVGAALVAGVVAVVSWGRARAADQAGLEAADRAALEAEPGVMVSQVTSRAGQVRISGLRDPLAPSPASVIAHQGLPQAALHFVPFVSLDPRIVERRAWGALQPPPSVQVQVEGGRLRLTGIASRAWIKDARLLGRALPGVEYVDDSALHEEESLEALRAAARYLETVEITFPKGGAGIEPREEASLPGIANRVDAAFRAADEARVGACLTITGHADSTGPEDRNQRLSTERASAVAERLASMGVAPSAQRHLGAGVWVRGPHARTVTFRLDVDEARTGPGCGEAP
jgi:OOP family OmpA-OmpF porin